MIVDSSILILTTLTMFVMSVLLFALIFSRLHWLVKAFLIVISLFLGAASYYAHEQARGWPVAMTLPQKFQLLASAVTEPSAKDPGSITIWLVESGKSDPRAIRIPYSKEMHKMMQQSRGKQEQGQEVHIEGKKSNKTGGGGDRNTRPTQPLYDFVPPPSAARSKD